MNLMEYYFGWDRFHNDFHPLIFFSVKNMNNVLENFFVYHQ